MKKGLLGFFLLLASLFTYAYAGGGITHMFLAEETIALLPDAQLRNLLLDNLEAYLVGAYYPDSGYVAKDSYGEDSHWDFFIYTFADYIKEKYPDPAMQNPKLVAFLFGCAAHRISDEIIHWIFYNVSKDFDFHGVYEDTHQHSDIGIDLLINIDKNQWFAHPKTWWVPVGDLLQVYHRMGKDQYTAEEITWGNSVISVAGYGERLISASAYPYFKWKMPWTAAHYYDWPEGGILMNEQKIAAYQMSLWQRLTNKTGKLQPAVFPARRYQASSYQEVGAHSAAIDFANNTLAARAVRITTKQNVNGSIELQAPVITQREKFGAQLNQLKSVLTK